MIPKDLVYRIYGDSLAIIMNVREKRVVLLKGESLLFWKGIMDTNRVDASERKHPLFEQLVRFGVIDGFPNQIPPVPLAPNLNQSAQEVDIGVVNLWAFKNRIPISGHFELTGRCNLRCRHCYCVFNTREDSLSTEQIFRIVDDLKDSGTFGLVLTGGELFCRKDILDILKYLSEKKFVIRINSNGTLIDEAVVKTMAGLSNIYRIHISLYGSEPEIHDRITNTPGSYYKTVHSLRLLKEAGFDLRINCSIMKSNVDNFQRIQDEIGDKMGIPVHFDSEIFPKDDGGVENLAERLDDSQMQDYLRERSTRQKQAQLPKKQKLCKAGFSFFSICEDGNLFPCLKMKRFYRNPLGNVSLNSFSEIWQGSKSIQRIRESLEQKLRECDICDLTI